MKRWILLYSLAWFATVPAAWASAPLPNPPQYGVVDEAAVLSPKPKRALETLLVEHERISGEQVMVGIFSTLGEEDLASRTNEIFRGWKIGQARKNNGVLLALYWKEHKTRIEVGYGLEALLTDARAKDIIEEILVPSLKSGQNDRAVQEAVIGILTAIESPLIANGRAREILNSGGEGRKTSNSNQDQLPFWVWAIFFIAFILFGRLRYRLFPEAHYTSSGWGVGGGGGWSGGGGFSGGGGDSGGGGASGSW